MQLDLIDIPVLAPLFANINGRLAIGVRLIRRSDGNNEVSPNIFSLDIFVSSRENTEFQTMDMLIVQWRELDSDNVRMHNSLCSTSNRIKAMFILTYFALLLCYMYIVCNYIPIKRSIMHIHMYMYLEPIF